MWKVLSRLGLAASIISIVMLARYGFELGSFVAPLQLVLDWYEAFMRFVLGWTEPYIESVLDCLRQRFDWNLNLHSHWKHVFVLMALYFGAQSKAYWTGPRLISPTLAGLLVVLIWGVVVAFAAGVAAGTVAMDNAPSATLMAAFPLFGLFAFQLAYAVWIATSIPTMEGFGWWRKFWTYGRGALGPRTIAAITLVLLLGTQADKVPYWKTVPSPGIALLLALVVALAFRWIIGALIKSLEVRRKEGLTLRQFWRFFSRSINVRIGILVLQAIGGAILFILANAGWKLAGL